MIAHETELRSPINETFHVKHQLGARKIIGQYLKVFMKRKLSLIYLNERSKITTNGNFELFNISRASFLRYLDLCNMQISIIAHAYIRYLENEVYRWEYSTKHLKLCIL